MTDQPTERLPNWYDPQRPLITFVDGPRGGQWCYADRWADEQRLAKLNGESPETGRTLAYEPVPFSDPVPHRLDSRVTATPWRWAPPDG